MAVSDSMFSVEIVVEELKSFVKCKDFIIKTLFADVFSMTLKEPTTLQKQLPFSKTYPKRKSVRKNYRSLFHKPLEAKSPTGQSVLFISNIQNLISNLKKYPMEVSLWSKLYPEYKLASTNIPWNDGFIDFLNNLDTTNSDFIVTPSRQYNIFDEFTSRRMASVTLYIKLSFLAKRAFTETNSPSEIKSIPYSAAIGLNPPTAINTASKRVYLIPEETGIIKTTYSRGRKPKKSSLKSIKKNDDKKVIEKIEQTEPDVKIDVPDKKANKRSMLSLVKSQNLIDINKQLDLDLTRSKSCSTIHQDQLNILNYIFGDNSGPFGNKVYCVSYFTVEKADSNPSSTTPAKTTENSSKISPSSSLTTQPDSAAKGTNLSGEKYTLKFCDLECKKKDETTGSVNFSSCSLDLPKEAAGFTTITKCKEVSCEHKKFRELPPPPDDRILLDLTNLKQECCDKSEGIQKVEEIYGGLQGKLKIGDKDPCFCECECNFGFVKKTTYCKICKGYERLGEEHGEKRAIDMPFPCPLYHKLMDKVKSKPSTTGSDLKKPIKAKNVEKKSIDSEKDTKKSKKKKKEDKFKFNYGYTAPQIGHSRCALPCTGTMDPVPGRMGWLWTADNIPGMKFRPSWKPGAVNKHVLRLLKIAKNPEEAFAKKKRKKPSGKPKRPLKRPLLTVHKKDGEYTINLETMKTYNKPRAVNQVPYEDKDPLTYTIGRTDEENYQRRKKKERLRRRLEREQREFIQSAFRDMCEEICLKTYQQALAILPDAEKPDCTCYPAEPGADRTDLDRSCSCSEDSQLSFSDTDSDEWFVEVTPPIAHFDSSYKGKKPILTENTTQYSYLDYRVKLLDRYGNPVPRFFIGPEGKQECSDLGGFWDKDHKEWLEINIDGYVAPDGRWAPNIFIGPNGDTIDAELGKFQHSDGTWLVVGIDGFVDCNGKWRYYSKRKGGKQSGKDKRKTIPESQKPPVKTDRGKDEKQEKRGKQNKDRKQDKLTHKKSEATWSCFGDASAKYLSEMGIMGHGHDRKLLLDTLKKLIARGEKMKIPTPVTFPHSRKKSTKKPINYHEDTKCRHATPSSKGIVAVDEDGNKVYFRLKDIRNPRHMERIATLTDRGISLSSFHVPCFHSFINSEMLKKQLQRGNGDQTTGRDTTSTGTDRRHYRSTLA